TRTSESDKPDRVNHQSDSAFIEDALDTNRKLEIAIDRDEAPEFAQQVFDMLSALYHEHRASKNLSDQLDTE
ncbi:hypothetical protein ACEVQ6_23465, partial [Ciceribacter sp. sgz301302]